MTNKQIIGLIAAAAALPLPAAPITDPEATVTKLPTAADQYQFIQQRLAAWHEATHTTLN